MKNLIFAGFIAILCFQSCTKENNINPQQSAGNRNLVPDRNTTHTAKSIADIEPAINRCGTPVPIPIKGVQSPPIYVPGQPLTIR